MIATERTFVEPDQFQFSLEHERANENDRILISFLKRSHLGLYSLTANFPLSEETSLVHDFHIVELLSDASSPASSSFFDDVGFSTMETDDGEGGEGGKGDIRQMLDTEKEVEEEINRMTREESDQRGEETREFDPKYRIFECRVASIKHPHLLEETKLFVKILGTLDPMDYVQEEYPEKDVKNIFDLSLQSKLVKLVEKLDNPKNSAYTESIASVLVSSLVERNTCPHFPRLFGVFAGMQKRLSVNFSDEYDDLCDQHSFLKGLKEQKFEIVKTDYFVGCENSRSGRNMVSRNSEFFEEEFMNDTSSDDQEDFYLNGKEDGSSTEQSESESENSEGDEEEGDEEESNEDEGDEEESKKDSEEDEETKNEQHQQESFFSDVDELDILKELKKFRDTSTSSRTSNSSFDSVHSLSNFLSSMDILNDSSIPADISLFANEFDSSEIQETVDVHIKKKYTDNEREGEDDLQEKWLILKDVPCQIIVMEAFPEVLENELKKDISLLRRSMQNFMSTLDNPVDSFFFSWILRARVKLFDEKWMALTLQIVMALIAMQTEFNMTHNDLHTQNVLLEPCTTPFLFYQIEEKIYRVPTKGYIVKIIDYGRAVYTLNEELIMGDVFKSTGQAGEQFAYPGEFEILDAEAETVVPNPSFDLCRFACSVVDDVFKQAPKWYRWCDTLKKKQKSVFEFYDLMESWTRDDAGKSVLRHEGFKLYKRITRDVHHLVPLDILQKSFKDYFFCCTDDDQKMDSVNFLYQLKR